MFHVYMPLLSTHAGVSGALRPAKGQHHGIGVLRAAIQRALCYVQAVQQLP